MLVITSHGKWKTRDAAAGNSPPRTGTAPARVESSAQPRFERRGTIHWIYLTGLWLIGALPLIALNPERRPDSYSIRRWSTEQALPSDKVRSITQTADSYIWIATAQGLARFDGSRFTTFTHATNPELRGGGFYALQETPDGTLWCGGDNGLFRLRNGHFERFSTEQGLADNYVRALTLTRDGTLVACTRTGYSFIRDGVITNPGAAWKQITGITRSYLERADGTIWLGTEDGLWRVSGEKVERLSGTVEFPGTAFNSLFETADGTLLIGSSLGVRGILPDGSHQDYKVADGLPPPRIASMQSDRDGNIWIGTYVGLYRLVHGQLEPAPYLMDMHESPIQQMREDREGGWWVCTAVGLFHLRDNVSKNVGSADGLGQTSAYAVLEGSDGRWWIGLWGAGVYVYDQKRATRLPLPAALAVDLVVCLTETPTGTFWIGANSGLYRYAGDATTNIYQSNEAADWRKELEKNPEAVLPGIAHSHANSVASDGEGGIWVATDGALYHGKEGQFRAYTTANGLPGNTIKSVIRARNGDVWITAPPVGAARLRDNRWTTYLCGQELSSIFPRAVYQDASGAIWITTDGGGLNRFKDDRWRTFTVHDGLADDFVTGIGEDAVGNLWIPSARGVMRVPLDQFDQVANGKRTLLETRIFDRFDGLPPGEGNQLGWPTVTSTRDGRMLIATSHGIAVIDPRNYKSNEVVPPMRIERVVIDGVEADLSLPLVIPPRNNDVQIHYTALSFPVPEKVRFKVRLSPIDRDWIDGGTLREVRYNKLPHGKYVFHVIACNNDGVWNTEGVSFAFSVTPLFYQTTWFAVLIGCALLGFGFSLNRRRLRRVRQHMAHLESLVQERTRELREAQAHLEKRVEERTAALQQAQEEASLERARFKFIFESVPVGISWFVPGHESTHLVNPAHERITGVSAADSLITGIFERVSHPDDYARQCQLALQFVRREISEFSIEKRYLHPDGKVVWVVFTSRMFVDPITGTPQSVTTLVDITELKRSQEEITRERARFKFIFEALPVGISWMVSTRVATRIVNPAHAYLTGIPVQLCQQLERYANATHPLDRVRQEVLHQKLVAGAIDHYSLEKRYLQPDGFVRWVVLTIHHFLDATSREMQELTTLVDITVRKQAEAEREDLHRRLLESSRQAGMAEVATGVLHNVSNVLNSVNIATSCIAETLRKSKSANLSKVVALMREHEANLGEFITNDLKGKQLPGYLAQLAELMAKDQTAVLKELGDLQKSVEHIKDIVMRQQSFAKLAVVREPAVPSELVEDALKMNSSSLGRNDIQVIKDFADVPLVLVEKNKVLQILVNLVRNAVDACDEGISKTKQITLRVSSTGSAVRLAVADNGVGIAPETLVKMFSHGFTTKKDGHGFGLHSAAATAKELGGSLMVHSDGLGHGATFILEIAAQPFPETVSAQ